MTTIPTNSDDVIDSRDAIEAMQELEAIILPVHNIDNGMDELDPSYTEDERAEAREQYDALVALMDQVELASDDWLYGATLIRDSYFVDYAAELAEDIGAIKRDAAWPMCHIDWNAAADALRQDYTEVTFDGVTYWVR